MSEVVSGEVIQVLRPGDEYWYNVPETAAEAMSSGLMCLVVVKTRELEGLDALKNRLKPIRLTPPENIQDLLVPVAQVGFDVGDEVEMDAVPIHGTYLSYAGTLFELPEVISDE